MSQYIQSTSFSHKLLYEVFSILNLLVTWLINPLSANPTKWSNTFEQFVGNLAANCLSVFDHFVGLVLKGLKTKMNKKEIKLLTMMIV